MSENQKYYNRVGWIDIEGLMSTPVGLDIKFDIVKIGDIYARFKASVLGLSTAHINQFTVWNPADAVATQRQISVFAGYEQDAITTPLCKGFVFNALPTPPPEMWMNFDCMLSLDGKIPVEGEEPMYDKPIGEIFKKICSLMGVKYLWLAKNVQEDKKGRFDFTGSRDRLFVRFSEAFNVTVVMGDDKNVIVYDKRPWNTTNPDPNRIRKINIDTGLLMVGSVTIAGATIRTRLNDSYSLMEWVRLESLLIPSASGDYMVLKKHHVGHLRGEEWYTELTLIRKG